MKFTRFCTTFRHLDSNWMPSSLVTKAKIKTKTNNNNNKKKKQQKETTKDGEGGRFGGEGRFQVSIQITMHMKKIPTFGL